MTFTWPYTIGAAVIIGVLLFGGGYLKGRADGRVTQLQDSVDAYEKRSGVDNDVSKLDRYSRCLELGGLRVDCEQLRGVDQTTESEQSGKTGD